MNKLMMIVQLRFDSQRFEYHSVTHASGGPALENLAMDIPSR